MLIDSHCHLEAFVNTGRLEAILAAAKKNGVKGLITVGTRPDDWVCYEKISKRFSNLFFSVGLHPSELQPNWQEQEKQLSQYLQKAIAIGEIGLDFYRLPENDVLRNACIDRQLAAFESQVNLARINDLPIIVHCREAFEAIIQVLTALNYNFERVLFHCFTGKTEEALQLKRLGSYVSFSGILTYPNAKTVRESFKLIPRERLLLETDAPYLSPVPFRGKENQPAFLKHTAIYASELSAMEYEVFCEQVLKNTQKFFQIDI